MADEDDVRMPDDVARASLAIMQRETATPKLPGRLGAEPLLGERAPVTERVADPDPADGAASEAADDSEEADTEEEADPDIDPEADPDDVGEEEEDPDDQGDEDPEVEVTVDGETTKVKLSELKNNYSGEKAIEKRLQQATELRNGYYQYGSALYKGLQLQAEKLKQLDSVLQAVADPQIDWEKLRIQDPNKYLLERDKQRDAQEKRRAIADEQKRIEEGQAELTTRERQVRAEDEARLLTQKLPILRDPQKGKALMTEMINSGSQHYGFQPQEIAEVIDHRMLLVLNDAVKYRKLVAKKAAKMEKGAPGKTSQQRPATGTVKTLLRPGGNPGFTKKMIAAKQTKAVTEQARRTGDVEDVAKTLIQPARRK